MLKQIVSLGLLMTSALAGFSNHIRGVDMYSTNVSGRTYKVYVEVYMRLASPGSTNDIFLNWGDGTQDTIPNLYSTHMATQNLLVHHYERLHTFASDGTYEPELIIQNWDNVINMTDPTNQAFKGRLKIVVSSFLGPNHFNGYTDSLPQGTVSGDDYSFNLGVNEPDGNTVVIEQQTVSTLATPMQYQFPSSLGGSESITANVYHFDNISAQGAYIVSFAIKEYNGATLIAQHVREFIFDYPAGIAGIDEYGETHRLSVYPNPCNQVTYIGSTKDETVDWYNAEGKKLLSTRTNQSISTDVLAPGFYLLRSASGSATRLIKE